MVADSGNVAKKALTIAIRYAAVRRQFASSSADKDQVTGKPMETQLLDYTIHQHRLLPLLAQAYAMHFTSVEMSKLYDVLMEQLNRLKPGDEDMDAVIETLKETHATSAGLKAFCTWNCLNTIEQCRQSLGGHGYSSYTGLAQMYNDFAVQCSWEVRSAGESLSQTCRETTQSWPSKLVVISSAAIEMFAPARSNRRVSLT